MLGAGRRVAIAWLNAGVGLGTVSAESANAQSLPRDLSIVAAPAPSSPLPTPSTPAASAARSRPGFRRQPASHPRLLQHFVPELQHLRFGKPIQISNNNAANVAEGGGGDGVASMGQQLEIAATFIWSKAVPAAARGDGHGARFGVAVFVSDDRVESTSITVDTARQVVCVNGTMQGNDTPRCGVFADASRSDLAMVTTTMHMYIDASTIEVIVDQYVAITACVNPSSANADGIMIFGGDGGRIDRRHRSGGSGVNATAEVWRLRPI